VKTTIATICVLVIAANLSAAQNRKPPVVPMNINPPAIASDKSVRYDYDIIYIRGTRRADGHEARWAEFSNPTNMENGADLMLLHPDGSEEVLVSGKEGSCLDPQVSFDGQSVYFAKFTTASHKGSNIFKLHVPSRKLTKLTDQQFTPNTGAADWSKLKLSYGVFNLGPCPAPGGKIIFTSNRNAHVPPRGYPKVALQLFSMDDDGANAEQIGYLNVACALHPTILKDGRILFSSLESQAIHEGIHWGIWSIYPDGTDWNPIVSGLLRESGAVSGFHFQTQLADGGIVVERYYNQNQKGFGTLFRIPPTVPANVTPFGPGDVSEPRNQVPFRIHDGYADSHTMPFTPWGMEMLTPWIGWHDDPAPNSIADDPASPRIGKVTHPCGAPDNHLLVAWTLGPIGGPSGGVREGMGPQPMDSGICLIKFARQTHEPGEMLMIKNDPNFNEQWPRPLVPYERIHGVKEPARHVHKNDGQLSPQLPEGTPFGLVGSSSLYKRETAPNGKVTRGNVTAEVPAKPGDTLDSIANYRSMVRENWWGQGADAGRYDNNEIHAIRILIQEPLTDVSGHRVPLFASHANERLRILGEIPVRKFIDATGNKQPTDPDGNPDTSFLAKIPADQPFTFQTLDKNGMVLNMAQTWHQLRPGEIRNNCGGCHAHSQRPTPFENTAAASPEYAIFDLTQQTPLITSKARDESNKRWDQTSETGVRYHSGPLNVEYRRDIIPIFQRSCVACHTHKSAKPAGGLVLDDDDMSKLTASQFVEGDEAPRLAVPATYSKLVSHRGAESFYMYRFQSRRSYLIWKIYGKRLDGWTNDTFPSLVDPHDLTSGVKWKGKTIDKYEALLEKHRDNLPKDNWNLQGFLNQYCDVDYAGSQMPPPDAVKGTYKGEGGRPIKVEPLSDEDRMMFVRWIDLGCPIDLDPQYDPANPASKSYGWMGDDQRPTLTVTYPAAGANTTFDRILVGMCDAYSGLDPESFKVSADFAIDGIAAGEDLSAKFKPKSQGVRELILASPITTMPRGKIKVSIKDRQGNINVVERTFSVAAP